MKDANVLLSVRGITKQFSISKSGLFTRKEAVSALDDVSFDIVGNETLGVVGESGCGKSTMARALMGIVKIDRGEIEYCQATVRTQGTLQRAQMVFQDSFLSLNPRLSIVESIAFGPHANGIKKAESRKIAFDLLRAVGLDPKEMSDRYPHQLSGGQRQRVNIARALALRPELLILDEAVSALDKSIQAQVLNLLVDIKKEFSFTYVFISHDLNVVRYISDRVLVMYLGHVVEIGSADAVYKSPKHPYTVALLGAAPSINPLRKTKFATLIGDPPSPINPPTGCRFRTRCSFAETICETSTPRLDEYSERQSHSVACHMFVPGSGHSKIAR